MTPVEERLTRLLHEVAPTPGGVNYDAVVRKARRRRATILGTACAAVAVIAGSVGTSVTLTSTGSGPAQLTTSPSPSTTATSSNCYPSPLRLSSDRVRVDSSVTVSSPAFACDTIYPAGKTYTLMLGQVGRGGDPLPLGVVPVNRNGSFRADVRIPASASPGQAYVLVQDSAFDQSCHQTSSQSASCASYSARLTVLPSAATTGTSCELNQLSVTFGYTGLGAGQEWGVLLLRNQGTSPCALRDPVTVVPLDQAGQPMSTKRPLVSQPAAPPLVLAVSSVGAGSAVAGTVPSVGLLITGTYHYRSDSCPTAYTTTPYSWELTMTGKTRVVRNEVPGAGVQHLSTCQGDFGINDQVAGRSLPVHPAPK